MLHPKAILPVETNPSTKFRELPFKRVKMAKTQRRFQNRYCLEPDVNLKDYRCHAAIDFVEFEFTSADPTQFRYVQDLVERTAPVRKPNVKRRNGTEGSATEFSVRVQDPTVANLLAISAAIEARFGCKVPPKIRVIEVSVDFYPRKPDDAAREIMVGVLQRTYCAKHDVYDDPMSRPRFFGAAGKKRFLQRWFKHTNGRTDMIAQDAWLDPLRSNVPPVDATMYFGPKEGDVQIKIMSKVSDQRKRDKKKVIALSDEAKRARIEVTLRGDALSRHGLNTLSDLKDFRFNTLQGDYFHFALPTFQERKTGIARHPGFPAVHEALNERREQHFLRTGIAGLGYVERARSEWMTREPDEGHSHLRTLRQHLKARGSFLKRDRSGHDLVAYEALNEMVQVALKGLLKREVRGVE